VPWSRKDPHLPVRDPFRDNSLTRFIWTAASRKAVLKFGSTRVDVYAYSR